MPATWSSRICMTSRGIFSAPLVIHCYTLYHKCRINIKLIPKLKYLLLDSTNKNCGLLRNSILRYSLMSQGCFSNFRCFILQLSKLDLIDQETRVRACICMLLSLRNVSQTNLDHVFVIEPLFVELFRKWNSVC